MTAPADIPGVYIDLYQGKSGIAFPGHRTQPWRWRARAAGNNRILAISSEAYTNPDDALHAIYLLFGEHTDIYLRDGTNPTTKIRTGNP